MKAVFVGQSNVASYFRYLVNSKIVRDAVKAAFSDKQNELEAADFKLLNSDAPIGKIWALTGRLSPAALPEIVWKASQAQLADSQLNHSLDLRVSFAMVHPAAKVMIHKTTDMRAQRGYHRTISGHLANDHRSML